jgi:hypothetical protein
VHSVHRHPCSTVRMHSLPPYQVARKLTGQPYFQIFSERSRTRSSRQPRHALTCSIVATTTLSNSMECAKVFADSWPQIRNSATGNSYMSLLHPPPAKRRPQQSSFPLPQRINTSYSYGATARSATPCDSYINMHLPPSISSSFRHFFRVCRPSTAPPVWCVLASCCLLCCQNLLQIHFHFPFTPDSNLHWYCMKPVLKRSERY